MPLSEKAKAQRRSVRGGAWNVWVKYLGENATRIAYVSEDREAESFALCLWYYAPEPCWVYLTKHSRGTLVRHVNIGMPRLRDGAARVTMGTCE
jgi:hypothetical protein